MKSALTPEEWQEARGETFAGSVYFGDGFFVNWQPEGINLAASSSISGDADWVPAKALPALAAICLHRQPFGFTHQDVAELRLAADNIANDYRVWKPGREDQAAYCERLKGLADRIECLLEPAP